MLLELTSVIVAVATVDILLGLETYPVQNEDRTKQYVPVEDALVVSGKPIIAMVEMMTSETARRRVSKPTERLTSSNKETEN